MTDYTKPAPCLPSVPAFDCKGCERRIEKMPTDRQAIVIDATRLAWGVCPMRSDRVAN